MKYNQAMKSRKTIWGHQDRTRTFRRCMTRSTTRTEGKTKQEVIQNSLQRTATTHPLDLQVTYKMSSCHIVKRHLKLTGRCTVSTALLHVRQKH